MQKNNFWPYAITLSILAVFGASVATVVIASSTPVQKSDTYMMDYHEADDRANEIINNSIAFDKLYSIKFAPKSFSSKNALIAYKIEDKQGNIVKDAKLEVVLTRPDTHQYDIRLNGSLLKDGLYSFNSVKLPKEGRWDIMAKVTIGKHQKFYNLKTDTRSTMAEEY